MEERLTKKPYHFNSFLSVIKWRSRFALRWLLQKLQWCKVRLLCQRDSFINEKFFSFFLFQKGLHILSPASIELLGNPCMVIHPRNLNLWERILRLAEWGKKYNLWDRRQLPLLDVQETEQGPKRTPLCPVNSTFPQWSVCLPRGRGFSSPPCMSRVRYHPSSPYSIARPIAFCKQYHSPTQPTITQTAEGILQPVPHSPSPYISTLCMPTQK